MHSDDKIGCQFPNVKCSKHVRMGKNNTKHGVIFRVGSICVVKTNMTSFVLTMLIILGQGTTFAQTTDITPSIESGSGDVDSYSTETNTAETTRAKVKKILTTEDMTISTTTTITPILTTEETTTTKPTTKTTKTPTTTAITTTAQPTTTAAKTTTTTAITTTAQPTTTTAAAPTTTTTLYTTTDAADTTTAAPLTTEPDDITTGSNVVTTVFSYLTTKITTQQVPSEGGNESSSADTSMPVKDKSTTMSQADETTQIDLTSQLFLTEESSTISDINYTHSIRPQPIPITTQAITNASSYTENINTNEEKDDNVVLLSVLVCLCFIIVVAAVIAIYFCRKRGEKKKDVDFVHRRKNPAFMDQNINALAHQLNSRDSRMPNATRAIFRDGSVDGFEDVNLLEEDETLTKGIAVLKLNGIEQDFQLSDLSRNSSTEDNSKSLLTKHDTSFNPSSSTKDNSHTISMKKSSFKPTKESILVSKSEESIPPLPEKGQKKSESNLSNRLSHYDSLPIRESLPIKQRKGSARDVLNTLAPGKQNPEYDVLPLKTFARSVSYTDKQDESTLTMTYSNTDVSSSVLASSVDLSNSMDNIFQEALSSENKFRLSQDTDCSMETEGDIEIAHHDTIERMREREPANRTPSFIKLPRAASGSLRTAL